MSRQAISDRGKLNNFVGLVSSVLIAFGYGRFVDDPAVAKYIAGGTILYLAISLFVISPWLMWNKSQREIATFRERLRPRLSLVCDQDKAPYCQLQRVPKLGPATILRVGILNESDAVIKDVRVVVESFEFLTADGQSPATTSNILPVEHALRVMGRDDAKDGLTDVMPGDRPTAFVDLAMQATPIGQPPSKTTYILYAAQLDVSVNAEPGCLVTLRVEYGGPCHSKTLILEGGVGSVIHIDESRSSSGVNQTGT